MVAFSAADEATGGTVHPASYTEMFRHPSGLWTAAPQAAGWVHLVDAAAHSVWIPLQNITGSAKFGASDCSTLATAEGSAFIPKSAGSLSISTKNGEKTLTDLLGHKTSKDGWTVQFSFSAAQTP